MNDKHTFLYVIVFLVTLTLTILVGRIIIPYLKKRAEQPIYEEGPSWHMSKSGTPTMGGLSFLISITFSLLLSSLYKYIEGDAKGALSILICATYALINSSIGIVDDLTKLRHKKNAGLTPRAKLVLQFIASVLFLIARVIFIGDETTFSLPFSSFGMDALYYPIAMIILVGITNCANLTDGVDGLASSVAFAIGISSFYISYQRYDTVCLISAALSAAAIGFLVFNAHPAKVFMGDTGSLFLGSLVATMAFEIGNPLLAVTSGGVYVIEGLSVIAQVMVFKTCKKRLFKMAPIHHHLEKCGWDENKICIFAIILTLLFAVITTLLCMR